MASDESTQQVEDITEQYYQLKKHLLIAALLSVPCVQGEPPIEESPTLIYFLLRISTYNVHTQKLLMPGGGPTGFMDMYKQVLTEAKVDCENFEKVLWACYEGKELIEFIDLTKTTVEDYINNQLYKVKNAKDN